MSEKVNVFPIYRKYVGINTWFKITDDRHFTEVKKLGERYLVHELEATQYPEMILIQDMIACAEGRWEAFDSDSFEEMLKEMGK